MKQFNISFSECPLAEVIWCVVHDLWELALYFGLYGTHIINENFLTNKKSSLLQLLSTH
jgi:hypothetical protein